MNSNNTYWEALIGKYLSGNYSPEEEIEIQQWINSNAHNKEKFESYKKIWDSSYKEFSIDKSEIVEGWNVIESAILSSSQKEQIRKQPKSLFLWNRAYVLRTAAILLLVILGGITLYQNFKTHPEQIFVSSESGKSEQHMLPDGSIVWLNAASQIHYDQEFLERQVQ